MPTFKVNDMSCNHCVNAINQAIHAIDPQATVNVDLATKIVNIESNTDTALLHDAISEAGYTPE